LITSTIERLIRADLNAVKQLELVKDKCPEGAYVAAGFVRNRVWDAMYTHARNDNASDVDVVYFCTEDTSKSRDLAIEAELLALDPDTGWQVRNQARMHYFGGHKPFISLEHALTHWAETATGVGVRLANDGTMEFVAPFGFEDLEKHVLRITPIMKTHDAEGFERRLQAKGWLKRWPKLTVIR
jgi:hypothetical protein